MGHKGRALMNGISALEQKPSERAYSLLFLIPDQNGISVPKNSTTTKNAAEKIYPKVPKKKDNLARPFFVFAPATENTTPTKDNAKLAIYKPLTRSPPSTDFTKFAAGKKNTSEA